MSSAPCGTCGCHPGDHYVEVSAAYDISIIRCTSCIDCEHKFSRTELLKAGGYDVTIKQAVTTILTRAPPKVDLMAEAFAAPRNEIKRIQCDWHRNRTGMCVCQW